MQVYMCPGHCWRQAVVTMVLVVYIRTYIIMSLDLSLAPTITDSSSTATTIFASWEVDPNAVQYNVSLSPPTLVDMQQQTNDGNVTFERLVPATTYTLTVRGVDFLGRDGDPTVVTITTDRATGELAYVQPLALHDNTTNVSASSALELSSCESSMHHGRGVVHMTQPSVSWLRECLASSYRHISSHTKLSSIRRHAYT